MTTQYIKTRVAQPDDLCVWADGTTCYYSELEEYLSLMSDDFEIIPLSDEVREEPNDMYLFNIMLSNAVIDWCSSDLK